MMRLKSDRSLSLFDSVAEARPEKEILEPGAAILRGFALRREGELLTALESVSERSPFRHMVTPGGFPMSVAMTNCGGLGWITDRKGYRYDAIDPETGKPWPAMPDCLVELAGSAAEAAGF